MCVFAMLIGRCLLPYTDMLIIIQTQLSILLTDHAGMQSSLRKLASTAGKCAGFDVVLTTYDSIKTKEVTVPVDSSGIAILGGSGRNNDGDGWFTSRAPGSTQSGVAAPQKCHQMSVLHRMSWFRVIFMDVLGRKGVCQCVSSLIQCVFMTIPFSLLKCSYPNTCLVRQDS